MDRTGIIKIVIHDDSATAIEAYNKYPERIIPLVRIGSPQKSGAVSTLDNALATGEFKGIGEVSLRHWSRGIGEKKGAGTSLESEKRRAGGSKGVDTQADSAIMKDILDLAAHYRVPVAVHLDNNYANELENLLEHNRKGNVIWSHVGTTPTRMTDPQIVGHMMDANPNLYADLSAVSPFMRRSSLLDETGILNDRWKELLEGYSDRFFFGIDVFLEEHLESVESEVMYWRKVLGQLRPETALKIGCGNIEEITSSTYFPRSTFMPAPTPDLTELEPSWKYVGLTHAPINFKQTLVEEPSCTSGTMLMPFFNYLNTKHAEGPKKWYIKACPGNPVKVYLPAEALLRERSIGGSKTEEMYNGEKVLTDVRVDFEASKDVSMSFMHLALLADIKSEVEGSSTGYKIFKAGTHIGYLYTPPQTRYSLDFAVEDKRVDPGLTDNNDHWWNIRVNPLDYFIPEVRQSILESYQHNYQRLAEYGTTAFADLEYSRLNLNEDGQIWGVWFKDQFPNAFSSDAGHSGTAWSVINVVKTVDLTQETYWKILEEFPDLSGLFVEQARKETVGQSLYEGGPIGENRFFILSGDATSGVARIENRRDWENSRTMHLKFEVIRHSAPELDDILRIEGFIGQDEAESSGFSEKSVRFRRTPCHSEVSGCR